MANNYFFVVKSVYSEENTLFAGVFGANRDKKRRYGSIYKEMELEIDCLTRRVLAESLQLQMLVLHQSKCIFKAGLTSPYDGWAKCKEKVPDVSDHNQMQYAIETTCNFKLKFT